MDKETKEVRSKSSWLLLNLSRQQKAENEERLRQVNELLNLDSLKFERAMRIQLVDEKQNLEKSIEQRKKWMKESLEDCRVMFKELEELQNE